MITTNNTIIIIKIILNKFYNFIVGNIYFFIDNFLL